MGFLGGIIGRTLPTPCPAHPSMRLPYFPNRSRLNQFHHPTEILPGMNLCPHLSLHTCFGCSFGDNSTLMNIAGERFLTINMLFCLQGRKRGKGMSMLCGRNHHCIEIINLFVKITKVGGCTGILAPRKPGGAIEIFLIHIAKRYYLFISTTRNMSATSPPYPDQSNRKFPIGRFGMSDGGKSSHCRCYGSCSDKGSST